MTADRLMKSCIVCFHLSMVPFIAAAADRYTIDPDHTYPSFSAPHIQGISTWRGKFNKTSGHVTFDQEKQTGTVDITIDTESIDFGHPKMNEHAKGADMFDVARYPIATYKADKIEFKNGAPASVDGELTLHGVTKKVPLEFNSFKCIMHPMYKVEVCGADLSAKLDRNDFGIGYAVNLTGSPMVELQIQVEALKDQQPDLTVDEQAKKP